MTAKVDISFTLNGHLKKVSVPIDMSALTMLRDMLGMTGTKLACGEGECGACTILVDGASLNSCLMYAAECDGRTVLTIEGLRTAAGLDPMQKAFVEKAPFNAATACPA